MQINEQIKEGRKKLGLTQEQVANYLGVSAPAVNKWEKGSSYPDITLLPALARLLNIDMNTLFSFNEELSEFEVKAFIKELAETALNDNIEAAFKMAVHKIAQYPRCDSIIYAAADTLNSCLALSEISADVKAEYEKQILDWFDLSAQSTDESIKYSAISVLTAKYIKSSDFYKAEKLIEQLPERSIDKNAFKIDILIHEDKKAEAETLLQGKILQDIEKLQRNLCKLIDLQLQNGTKKTAEETACITRNMDDLFGLWNYASFVPDLYITLFKKDQTQSIRQINSILEAANTPWNMKDSPLFYKMSMDTFTNIGQYFIPEFIAELKNSSEYDFLRSNEEFKKLLYNYSKTE